MKEPGHIYILVNPSIEGLVKIGKTTRDPESRAREISQATGVPTPFYLAFSIQVADCHSAEEYVYAILEHNGFKRSPNREFFQMALREAIEVLMAAEKELAANDLGAQQPTGGEGFDSTDDEHASPEHPGYVLLEKASATYYGIDDEIQDDEETLRLLYQAKALNFPAGYTALGEYYMQKAWNVFALCTISGDRTQERNFYRKALEILKEGALRGHGRCYVKMAEIYSLGGASQDSEPDPQNAVKCWKKYFRSQAFINNDDDRWDDVYDDIFPGSEGFSRASYAKRYLTDCFHEQLHLDEDIRQILLRIREEIRECIKATIGYYEDLAAKEPPVLENPEPAKRKWEKTGLISRLMGSKNQVEARPRPADSDREKAEQARRFLSYMESAL